MKTNMVTSGLLLTALLGGCATPPPPPEPPPEVIDTQYPERCYRMDSAHGEPAGYARLSTGYEFYFHPSCDAHLMNTLPEKDASEDKAAEAMKNAIEAMKKVEENAKHQNATATQDEASDQDSRDEVPAWIKSATEGAEGNSASCEKGKMAASDGLQECEEMP